MCRQDASDAAKSATAMNGDSLQNRDRRTVPAKPDVHGTASSVYDVVKHELKPFLEIAAPTVVLQIGFVFAPFLTASYVGRKFGSVYLSGYSLANLTGNLCALSLLSGLYSASDTLSPQAFGANNHKEVGLLAIRGFLGSLVILVTVNALLLPNMQQTLQFLGEDPDAAEYATQWYSIYVVALPFYSLYSAVWKFLSAQNVMWPLLYSCIISCLVVLPVSMEVFTQQYGFLGSAMAYATFQISQALLVLLFVCWKQPHVAATWPGLQCWREALDYHKVLHYLSLSAGGILAQSEWVYWEALGLIIGTMGVLPLSVHTIPTQLIMATFMCPFGIGSALSIRMGVSLPVNVERTKLLVVITLAVSLASYIVTTILLYVFRFELFRIFTTEQDVIDGADGIWLKVCIYNVFVTFFATVIGVTTGLGMQWTLGVVNFVFLWIIGIPVTYYSAVVQGQGLGAIWTWIIAPYIGIDIVLVAAFVLKDWHAVSREIQCREGMEKNRSGDDDDDDDADEQTHLLTA